MWAEKNNNGIHRIIVSGEYECWQNKDFFRWQMVWRGCNDQSFERRTDKNTNMSNVKCEDQIDDQRIERDSQGERNVADAKKTKP
jgi:hypothetical protein